MTDGTRWLTDTEQVTWRAYLRGSRALEIALDADLRAHGIGLSEYEILSMLSEAKGGQLRMSAMAALVQQSRSRITHTAARLEDRGWVERRRATDDGRGVLLVLTEEGRAEIDVMATLHVESVRRHLIDLLDDDQLHVLGRAMASVYRTATGEDRDPTHDL